MRIVHLSCAVLLAACTTNTRAPASESDPAGVVQAFYDAFNRRDVEGVVAAFAPDAALVVSADGEIPADTVAQGTGDLRRYYKQWFVLFPDMRLEVRERSVNGRTVVDHLLVRGDPCGGKTTAIVIYEVVDGRIRTSTDSLPDTELETEVVSIEPGVHVSCPVNRAP
jgi:hypothetical protein